MAENVMDQEHDDQDQQAGQNGQEQNQDQQPNLDEFDADQREFHEATEAAKSDDEGKPSGDDDGEPKAGDENGDKAGDQQKHQDGEQAAKGDQQQADGENQSVMIPKARFDEVNTDRDRKAQEASYWRGVAEASMRHQQGSQQAGQQQTQQQEPTPDEVIADAKAQMRTLAQKFDDGEITAVEWEQQRSAYEDRIDEARFAAHQPQQGQQQQTQQQPQKQQDDLYLEQLTVNLEQEHPYTTRIKDDADWAFLRDKAVNELRDEGTQLTSDTRGVYTLRKRMAELTDRYGPILTGENLDQQKQGGSQQQPAGDGQGKAHLSEQAQQRSDKLDLQGQHPPDTRNMGSPGDRTEITDADINSMSDDEIAALPASVRSKFLDNRRAS
ncbi:MAG TPA: hypothetical protein VKA32_02835 [Gammaproteobacteria bacterium]|nr:hypothetical protein [Gammaproteobacteria bacterium]